MHAAHAAAAPSPCASHMRSEAGPRGAACEEGSGAEAAWDTELHLPLWVTATERSQIEERLNGFVRQLLEARPRWREDSIVYVLASQRRQIGQRLDMQQLEGLRHFASIWLCMAAAKFETLHEP